MIESSHRAEIGLMQSQKWMDYGRKRLNDQSQNIDTDDHLLGPKVPLFSNYMADLTACGSRSMVTEKEPFFCIKQCHYEAIKPNNYHNSQTGRLIANSKHTVYNKYIY